MQCPYCQTTFPLTWGRYFGAPTGRHICPSCGKESRLPLTVSYWLLVFMAACLGGVPLALLLYVKLGSLWWSLAGWVIGALLTAIPIDKIFLDGRYRKLTRIAAN